MKRPYLSTVTLGLLTVFSFLTISFGLAQTASAATVCKNQQAPGCQKARTVFIAAWSIVVGDEMKYDLWVEQADNIINRKIVTPQQFAEGIKLSQATEFWKLFVVEYSPLKGGYATVAVKNAYREVYGRDPLSSETAAWLDQIKLKKAWYTTIILAEEKKLYKDSALYTQHLKNVFGNAYGRWPDETETKHWTMNKDHYRIIRGHLRSDIWRPYKETEVRKLTMLALKNSNKIKTGNATTNAKEVDKWYQIFKVKRSLYDEMMAELGTPVDS